MEVGLKHVVPELHHTEYRQYMDTQINIHIGVTKYYTHPPGVILMGLPILHLNYLTSLNHTINKKNFLQTILLKVIQSKVMEI